MLRISGVWRADVVDRRRRVRGVGAQVDGRITIRGVGRRHRAGSTSARPFIRDLLYIIQRAQHGMSGEGMPVRLIKF
jgi:hypothetical protein